MNICFLVDDMGEGGISTVILSLSKEISTLGHQVHIISLCDIVKYDIEANVKLHIASSYKDFKKNKWYNFKHKAKLAQSVVSIIAQQGIEFDLFVSHKFFTTQVVKIAKLPNLYHCIHIDCLGVDRYIYQEMRTPKILIPIKKIISKIVYKLTYQDQKLIAVSQNAANNIKKCGAKPKSVRAIYNPFDIDRIRQLSDSYLPDEVDYIVHVGRLAFQKNQSLLIKAYHQAKFKQKLILLGQVDNDAYLSEIQTLIEQLGLTEKVIIKPFNTNPYPWIKHAKLLVLSSHYEGFGMVLVEALALNTMVVSTDCLSGPAEILTNDLASFLSPVGDVEALASNMLRAIQHPVDIDNRYTDRFQASQIAQAYIELIHHSTK